MNEANDLEDMDIDEIALCRKGAHAEAKFVIQKTATRTRPHAESGGVDGPDPRRRAAMVQQQFALAVLKVDGHGPSILWPEMYDALRRKGYSKEKAARISNARAQGL
jgi:hypothetical protein